jgi:hypothetical protein
MLMRRATIVSLGLFAAATLAGAASDRVDLAARFTPGQMLRYRIESSSKSTGKTTTPIVNPEGGTESSDSVRMVVRLEVLGVVSGSVRFRASYEKSAAESQSDALDLSARSFADRYSRLEGRTFEFSFGPPASISNVQDLTAAAAGQSPKAVDPMLAWLPQIVPPASLPKNGIAVGEKWKIDRPVAGAILTGLHWRGESTYVRSEPCGQSSQFDESTKPAALAPMANGPSPADCAVILTQFEIADAHSAHADATPEDYRRNGLRTSGTWTGSGESLDSYSLATGLLVSSTQSDTQQMDYQVVSAATGSSVHHSGKVQSQSQITLVSAAP